MVQTATNQKTGEKVALIGGQWVPITQTATNQKTGERVGLAGNQWVPIGQVTPSTTERPKPAVPSVDTAEGRLAARKPLQPVEAPSIFDYFTDRQAAIKQSRARAEYMGEVVQRDALEDIKTQTGFLDRLGDMFSKGLLSTRANIKDTQRAIEADPELKKQFTEEARRFAADKGVEVKGATSLDDVKKDFLRNAVPFALEQISSSIPGTIAAAAPLPGLGISNVFGGQAREAAELEGREDVELSDLARVAPGALAVTALDQLGLGGIFAAPAKTALGRIGKAALIEGGTEAIQSAIEYANPRLVTGSDIDAGELFEQVAVGALVGGSMGAGLRGIGEAATAPFRPKAKAEPEVDLENSPVVEQEYLRLVTAEVQALRDQNPDLTQRQAFNQVVKDAGGLYDTAIENVLRETEGEADVVPDADTGMDVDGGGRTGAGVDLEPTPTETSAPELGEIVGGGLERPVSGVSVPTIGEGAGVAPLEIAPAFDTTPLVEAPTRKERAVAAQRLVSDIVIETPELQDLSKGKYSQAATQMANAATRGEQFDPLDILYNVAGIDRPAPAPSIEAAPAPPKVARDFRAAIKMDDGAIYAGEPGQTHFDVYEANSQLDYDKMAPEGDGFVDSSGKFYTRKEASAAIGRTGIYDELYVEDFDIGEEVAPSIDEAGTAPPPAVRTMNDMAGIGTVNPENTNEVLVEGGGVQLTPLADNILKVDSLRAVEKGGGRKAMEQLTKVADANGTALQLSPEPFAAPAGKEMTPTELSSWYGEFGFQEQPDGTMARPAASPPPATITPEAAATPQEILADLEGFAVSEAQDRDFDQDAFLDGVADIREGRKPLSIIDALKSYGFSGRFEIDNPGDRVARSRVAGAEWAQDRVAEAQAAPTQVAMATTPAPAAPAPAAPAPTTTPTQSRTTININGKETVIESAPRTGQPKVVSNGKPVVLTAAQTRTALEKAKAKRTKANRIQKRIANTNKMDDVLSGQIELGKLLRGDKENWALLRGAVDTLNINKWRVVLPTLFTNDIFRILKGRIPALDTVDQILQRDIEKFQTREYFKLSGELETIANFLKKHPKAAQALSDLQFASVAYQVDPTKANSAEEYFNKVDGKAKEIRAQIKAEKDPSKKGNLEKKLGKRFEDIESIYTGVPGKERVIGWRDLARPEFGGNKAKEIFALIRDAHRRDLMASYNGLRSRLMETKKDEALADALEKLEAQFKPAMDQVIYFPAMRFGSYYARVDKGANSVFKMFETEKQRNQFKRLMELQGRNVTETGNVEDLRNQFEAVTGSPLKEVLDLFDDNPKDIGALKGQVFDLWLQSLSSGDMRQHMAPRQMRAGYSTDILKNFANFRRSSINNQKRAQFGYKLRAEISRAKDFVSEQPDREKMEAFIKEIELRALADLMPPSRENSRFEQAIQLGNKMAFYQYLANPKTAVIQLTQMHIVSLPILAQKYGSVGAAAALSKYGFSGLGGFVASPLKAMRNKDGGFWPPSFNWEQPNLKDNPISALKEESDPELYEVLSEGWQEGQDINLYMDTFANDLGGYAMADPDQRTALQELMEGRPMTATMRGAIFTFEAMGALMHQMERVNREATYMAALELAYRDNIGKGQDHTEAKKNAIEEAIANTLEATFDFSTYNKPRVLTHPIGRISGQFFSYPWAMTSLLVRNMYTAIKVGKLEPGERKAAIQIATGTLLNLTAYAGITGIPLYGVTTMISSMLMWLFDGDEEEEGGLSYTDENGNIRATYNVDWWFRNVWIPKFFGADGTVQNLFGYDDDTAATVALAVEKGPISAITDVDLSNSVALDFMFFLPEESRAETPEGKLKDYLFSAAFGATGSMVMDYFKAYKDLEAGYTNRALEKLPKLYGNIAKANRFAEEGQTNYARELVGMDAAFWTNDKAVLQALGFASTEASQRQQQNYEGKAITAKVKAEREKMLAKIRKVTLDGYQYGYTPEVLAEHNEVIADWVKFNKTYPTDVIGFDSFYEVQANAIEKAAQSRATRGVPLDEKGKTPYLADTLMRRVETEEQ
jgi:hypothetical protein